VQKSHDRLTKVQCRVASLIAGGDTMHNNILKALLLVVILSAAGIRFPSNYAQSVTEAERLLQKAILLEDVDGDLQAAIGQYKKIAADNGKNRPVAAKALLRLAGCYEKLGREEAQKTYQQLIREFPDQLDAVRVAKEKLTLLEKGNANMSLRLVWEGPEVELMGAPSPDGRYICYTDWDTGDLAIHDLKTGEKRRLSGQTKWDGSFAEISRWSPDGKFIAYTWDAAKGSEVRVVGLDGQKPRTVFLKGCAEDWSPDGKQLLVRRGCGEGFVSLVSVSDGSVRDLVKTGRANVERDHMKFSPDGKYIAYDYQNEGISRGIKFPTEKDIYILSVDEKIQIPLVKNPANDYLLGWTPDGGNILFASDRSGAVDAWILPVRNGKPAGDARIVHKDIGAISPLGFTRDGAFFYGHGKDLLDIYIGTLDRKHQPMTATYRKLGLPFEGRNDIAEFSPDGKLLAFVRESSSSGTGSINNNALCIHNLETGKEQTFQVNLRVLRLRWAPDASSILINGSHETKSFVGIIDVQTGETKAIFPADKDIREELYFSPDWSPDGRSVYCFRLVAMKEKDPQCAIIAKDLGADQIRVVYRESKPALSAISVSPDGSWLAVASSGINSRQQASPTENILKLISIRDGEERELCKFFVNATSHPSWSRDGSYIFFTGRSASDEKWDVWYVPVEGGEPRGLGLSLSTTRSLSLHPDGVRFAFSSFGPTAHGPEVWMMENFLPKGK